MVSTIKYCIRFLLFKSFFFYFLITVSYANAIESLNVTNMWINYINEGKVDEAVNLYDNSFSFFTHEGSFLNDKAELALYIDTFLKKKDIKFSCDKSQSSLTSQLYNNIAINFGVCNIADKYYHLDDLSPAFLEQVRVTFVLYKENSDQKDGQETWRIIHQHFSKKSQKSNSSS